MRWYQIMHVKYTNVLYFSKESKPPELDSHEMKLDVKYMVGPVRPNIQRKITDICVYEMILWK